MTEISKKYVNSLDSVFPKEFLKFYNATEIENGIEGLVVLLHAYMLETEFVPKDIGNQHECMPQDWKTNGVFRIQYYHKTCPSSSFWMTCVPLYSILAVHAAIDDAQFDDNISIKLRVDFYVKDEQDFSNPFEVFNHLQELSKQFKDGFCFPLLAQLHYNEGCVPVFGFCGLVDDLKVYILKLLPVEGVISLSSVNKEFNSLTGSPFLWKHLFFRDFGKDGIPDVPTSSEQIEWKELYKKEYVKKKRSRSLLPTFNQRLLPPYRLREIFPVGPEYEDDIRIAFDPSLRDAFPHLYHRLQTPHIFGPYFGRYF